MKTEFSTFDIIKALGIPRERLRQWQVRSFIKPTIPAEGQGTKAVFTLLDVYGVALFRSLLENGFSRAMAGDYVKQFIAQEEGEPDHQKTAYILFRESVKNGEKVISVLTFARGDWKIDLETSAVEWNEIKIEADKYWRTIYIVNFETLRNEIDAALVKL
jgi:hypothetical protein